MEYTLAQIEWWSAAVARENAQEQASAILAGRMVWADAADVKRILRALGAS